MLKKGQDVPNFCLKDHTGKEHCIKDYKGKWKVVYFYPRDNTPGCTTEAKDFSVNIEEFTDKDALVFGISTDSIESHTKFIDKHDLKVTLLSDPDHAVHDLFGTWVKKKMYGKEYMGTQRSTFLINPDGKIEQVWDKVSVKGHVDDVKLQLNELLGV